MGLCSLVFSVNLREIFIDDRNLRLIATVAFEIKYSLCACCDLRCQSRYSYKIETRLLSPVEIKHSHRVTFLAAIHHYHLGVLQQSQKPRVENCAVDVVRLILLHPIVPFHFLKTPDLY